MASVFKRENGVWYVKYVEDGREHRKSLKTTSKAGALRALLEIEAKISQGIPVHTRKNIAIDEFTTLLLEHVKANQRPYTHKKIAHEWRAFCQWAKPIRLGEITHAKIADYKAWMLAEGYQRSTVRATLLTLSGVFTTAIKELRCLQGENPVKGVGLPKPDEKLPRYLSDDDIERLVSIAEDHSRDMLLFVALGVYAGLRKNELLNARWGWVSFLGRGRILVQNAGRFKTKSGKARKIPLSSKLRPILERHASKNPDEFIVHPEQPEKAGDEDSETKYRVDVTTAFQTVAIRAGFDWLTPHVLRHSFASSRAQRGVSLFKIQEWLGHNDPKTTTIYSHLSPDDDDIDK